MLTALYLVTKFWQASAEFGNPPFIYAPSYNIARSERLIYIYIFIFIYLFICLFIYLFIYLFILFYYFVSSLT